MLRKTMADCVPLLHICLAASMPFRMGIARSITTMSGWCCSASATASRPSAASATTRKPSWLSSSMRRPFRTMVWSSASRIRIDFIVSTVRRHRLSQGKRDPKQRTLAARRFHDETAAESADTLLHSDQPHAPFLWWIKPSAVVLYRQQQPVRLLANRNSHVPGVGVLDDVVQRLLHDSIDAGLVVFREFLGDLLRGDLHPQSASLGCFAGLPLQRRNKAEIVEHGRAQQECHVAYDADRLFEQPLDLVDFLRQGGFLPVTNQI